MVFPSFFLQIPQVSNPPFHLSQKLELSSIYPTCSMYCKHLGSSDLQPFADRICFRRLHLDKGGFCESTSNYIPYTKFSPIPPNQNNRLFFFKKNLRITENNTPNLNAKNSPKFGTPSDWNWHSIDMTQAPSYLHLAQGEGSWFDHFRNSIAWGFDPTVAGVIFPMGFPSEGRQKHPFFLEVGVALVGGIFGFRIPLAATFRGEDVGANQPQWHHWFFGCLEEKRPFFLLASFRSSPWKKNRHQNIFAWLRCSKASSQQIQFPSTCHKRFRKNVNYCNLPQKTLGERYAALLRARKKSTLCNKLGWLEFWTLNSTHVLGIFCKRHQLVVLVAECSKMSNQYFSLFKKKKSIKLWMTVFVKLKDEDQAIQFGCFQK